MTITLEDHLRDLENPRQTLVGIGVNVHQFALGLKKALKSKDENIFIKALNLEADVLALKVRTQQITGKDGQDLFQKSDEELKQELKRLRGKNDQG